METLIGLVALIALLLGFLGIIVLAATFIKPLLKIDQLAGRGAKFIPDRKTAGLMIMVSLGLIVVVAVISPAPKQMPAAKVSAGQDGPGIKKEKAPQIKLGSKEWQGLTVDELYILIGKTNSCAMQASGMLKSPGDRGVNPDCFIALNNPYPQIVENNELNFPKMAAFTRELAEAAKTGVEISATVGEAVKQSKDKMFREGDIIAASVIYNAAAQHEAKMWSHMLKAEKLRVAALKEMGATEIDSNMTLYTNKREFE
jgi:hypothetical protein